MSSTFAGGIFAFTLFFGILALIRVGWRIGTRQIEREGESVSKGTGAVEGAMFGLLGLMLAFLFSGALSRFDWRRGLVVEEANNIGTAWLRVDILPTDDQGPMRALFRDYLDSRISTYKKLPDIEAAKTDLAKSTQLQQEIWRLAVASASKSGAQPVYMSLLPALNAMFDITTTRTEATKMHPPPVIFGMLGVTSLACSLFAGYAMAFRQRWNSLHSFAFALVLSVTVYVIIDLEYPRLGLVRIDDSDEVLVSLRQSMN